MSLYGIVESPFGGQVNPPRNRNDGREGKFRRKRARGSFFQPALADGGLAHLPLAGHLIVAQDIDAAVAGPYLEVAMIGGEPAVDNFHHLDASISKVKRARFLFAAM